jgi:hypothetical protein
MTELEIQEAERVTRQMHAEARRLLQSRPRKFHPDALRKEIMARYPKIRAYLAKH